MSAADQEKWGRAVLEEDFGDEMSDSEAGDDVFAGKYHCLWHDLISSRLINVF
jgi:hypothetical protein